MFNLEVATFTGADDGTLVSDLIDVIVHGGDITAEWGILLHPDRLGQSRHPSLPWLEELAWYKKNDGSRCRISLHLCGPWAKALAAGDDSPVQVLPRLFWLADRVQLNDVKGTDFNFIDAVKLMKRFCGESGTTVKNWRGVPFIIQVRDDESRYCFQTLQMMGANVQPLFDKSLGKGVLPDKWEPSIPPCCGYAGGLTPENVSEKLQEIAKVSQVPTWIDMETGLRTGERFDLEKVIKGYAAIKGWWRHTEL